MEKSVDILSDSFVEIPEDEIVDLFPIGPAEPQESEQWLEFKAKPLSSRDKMVCRMIVAGISRREIAKALDMSVNYIQNILCKNDAPAFIEALNKEVDFEFQNMMFKVVRTVKKALDSPSLEANLKGAEFWAKYSGRLEQKLKVDVSAEDLVKQLLGGGQDAKGGPTALPAGNRNLIHDSGQERTDSPLPLEQCSEGHRLDPDI